MPDKGQIYCILGANACVLNPYRVLNLRRDTLLYCTVIFTLKIRIRAQHVDPVDADT